MTDVRPCFTFYSLHERGTAQHMGEGRQQRLEIEDHGGKFRMFGSENQMCKKETE